MSNTMENKNEKPQNGASNTSTGAAVPQGQSGRNGLRHADESAVLEVGREYGRVANRGVGPEQA